MINPQCRSGQFQHRSGHPQKVFCPLCGHNAASSEWWTKEQTDHAQQAAVAQVKSALGDALQRDATRWNRRQPRNSFISTTLQVKRRPRNVTLSPTAAEPMRLKITCPACTCRYAVIGAAYFCPSCGHNSADQDYDRTLTGIKQTLEALPTILAAIKDRDIGEVTARQIVENGLQNAVTAFQRCAEAIFSSLASSPSARRNAFQSLTEGNRLWQEATGKCFSDYLSENELDRIRIAFQQRHLLAHRQGIVDEHYLSNSGDTRYRRGQRIVVRLEMVCDTLNLVEKLVAGLQADRERPCG